MPIYYGLFFESASDLAQVNAVGQVAGTGRFAEVTLKFQANVPNDYRDFSFAGAHVLWIKTLYAEEVVKQVVAKTVPGILRHRRFHLMKHGKPVYVGAHIDNQ